jgi:serine/tyrosine/threonine adenylyltransferase
MILFALNALLDALAPLVGAELESGKAVTTGWGKASSPEQIKTWTEKGKAEVKSDMEAAFSEVYKAEYAKAMGKASRNPPWVASKTLTFGFFSVSG